jgi:GrpB-like predicted nucleotidyltransferase (UPF0157 family)
MIGLKKGMVHVFAYQPDWPDSFEQERGRLHPSIGRLVLDIQHIGSTSVPGLAAKPIIDIAVAVASSEVIPECRQPLCSLGYTDRGDCGQDGGYLFVKESAPEVRTHHLHIVGIDDQQWRNYLLLRDLLRVDETLRASYAKLKERLQHQFANDPRGYTTAKHDFICEALKYAV